MLVFNEKPDSIFSEKYRKIATNILCSPMYRNVKRIMITSVEKEDGASTVASNLALSLVEVGKKVILIDYNYINPKIHEKFNAENDCGLSDILIKQQKLFDVVKEHDTGLNVLFAGETLDNPSKAISSLEMNELLELLDKLYDYVIINAPYMLSKSDTRMLATKCHGTIIVINAKHTKKNKAFECKRVLNELNVKIMGVILNNVKK